MRVLGIVRFASPASWTFLRSLYFQAVSTFHQDIACDLHVRMDPKKILYWNDTDEVSDWYQYSSSDPSWLGFIRWITIFFKRILMTECVFCDFSLHSIGVILTRKGQLGISLFMGHPITSCLNSCDIKKPFFLQFIKNGRNLSDKPIWFNLS